MNALKTELDPALGDAELVQETLDGNRDAFRQIVTRYQSLICSVAYSGTGSVARSEDIAQETFVTAWKSLCKLRDPSHLRSWLCGIARNGASNARRRASREPAEVGEPLDPAHELPSSDTSPPEQAIREDEEAMLWRALGQIPENYREPLVLYYREHHSVEQVAFQLGLTEDATRQRLSRGRTLLQEHVLAFIEGTLSRTRPGTSFTLSVMSVLPMLSSTVGSVAAVSAAKGSSSVKAGSVIGGTGFGASVIGLVGALGGFVGWQMSTSDVQSELERVWIDRFWRLVVIGMAVFVLPAIAIAALWGRSNPWLLPALTYYVAGIYVLIGVPFAIWAWENHARVHGHPPGANVRRPTAKLLFGGIALLVLGVAAAINFGFPSGAWTDLWLLIVFAFSAMAFALWIWEWRQRRRRTRANFIPLVQRSRKTPSLIWVALATVCLAALLPLSIGSRWRTQRISASAARELMAAHPAATFQISERGQQSKTLGILVEHEGTSTWYVSPLDEPSLAALNRSGVSYKTLRQGHDFEMLGLPGRMLLVLSIFGTAAGTVILVRNRRLRHVKTTDER